MDFSTAFRFFTEDKTWKRKFGIAALLLGISIVFPVSAFCYSVRFNPISLWMALLSWLPLIFLALPIQLGYSIDISRNVCNGEKHLLPKWSFWHQFKQGGTFLFGLVIYLIPIMLLVTAISTWAINVGINKEFVPFLPGDPSVPVGLLIDTLFNTVGTFLMGALRVNYIRRNTLRSCFQFKSIRFITRKRWDKLLLIALLSSLISFVTNSILFTLDLTTVIWLRSSVTS